MRSEMSSNLELTEKIKVCCKGSRHKQSNFPTDHKKVNKQSVNNKHMKRTEKG